MSLDEIIKEAIKPLVPVCVIDVYGGQAEEFCVYTYTEEPVYYGDNEPDSIRYHVQLHWIFPWRPGITATPEVKAKKKQIKRALVAAGLDYPNGSVLPGMTTGRSWCLRRSTWMATFNATGIEGLDLSLEEFAAIPDNVVEEMLDAAGQVVVRHHKAQIRAQGLVHSGKLAGSIEAHKKAGSARNDYQRYVLVYPTGRHHIYQSRGVTRQYKRSKHGRTYTKGGAPRW